MMRRVLIAALAAASVCAVLMACAPADLARPGPRTFPSRAAQSIRGVTVTAETTTTRIADLYRVGVFAGPGPRPGHELACAVGTAVNSTGATLAVPGTVVSVTDETGSGPRQWTNVRIVRTPSGSRVEPTLVEGRSVPVEGVAPGGSLFCIVTYEYRTGSPGPVTVTWTLGGERRYVFRLRNP